MSVTFRKIIFWPHLISGVLAGIIIAIMSFTGVALVLEPRVLARADQETRQVQVPAPDAPRLSLDEVVARVKAARPEAQVSGITVYPEPTSAVLVGIGRGGGVYVNPYTGELREQGAQGWRAFFHTMEEWHRWLGAEGEHRAVGKALTGVSNALFLFLGITGLYLWWPRKWTRKTLRPVLWFRGGLRGKARDFNWHNVIGFWCLPVLIVLTATGVVMSYKWASDLVFTLSGNEPPAQGGPAAAPSVQVPTPPAGAQPLGLEPLFAEARKQSPAWESLTLRMGGGNAPRGNGPPGQGARPGGEQRGGPGGEARRGGPQALTFAIREQGAWPLFASTQVSFDPFTGQVLRREGYADQNLGRRIRTWLRFLHTGEALGGVGQFLAGLASLGALFLVWTGFALSWRRFFPRRQPRAEAAQADAAPVRSETAT